VTLRESVKNSNGSATSRPRRTTTTIRRERTASGLKGRMPTESGRPRCCGCRSRRVQANDAVLVVNADKGSDRNYIGGATFLELFKAWELGNRVYLLNPIPENAFGDEIAAMQPEVLHGDLSAIG